MRRLPFYRPKEIPSYLKKQFARRYNFYGREGVPMSLEDRMTEIAWGDAPKALPGKKRGHR